ncbi:hypothetical protein L596_029979 [Steinernema carpocapsae]|uniref:Uncharacterized protein n=1 Tax=Steinernema carpocapsae TaxID=34508 RepID=A0A4U5LRD8_STECR|nr:hypothetical protein L596_029979 [Steinernema carpocapsae]
MAESDALNDKFRGALTIFSRSFFEFRFVFITSAVIPGIKSAKMLTDKQKQMHLEAKKTMAQQKKTEDLLLQAKLEKQRRKDVFNSIQKLIDPVNR